MPTAPRGRTPGGATFPAVWTPFGELPDRLAADMTLAEQHEWLSRVVSRRSVLQAGALSTAVLTPMFWERRAFAAAPAVYGKHLAYGPDPTTSMHIAFAVAGAPSTARVRVTNPDGVDFTVPAQLQSVRGSTDTYGRALLDQLRPDTIYAYTITIDGAGAGGSTLRTAPATPAPFRFTAFGDQATWSAGAAMARRVAALAPRLHLMAGDLCYADTTGRGRPLDHFVPVRWDNWLQMNGPVAKAMPWMCVVGNHEMEPGFGMHGYAGVLARLPIGGVSPLTVPVASVYRVANVGFVGLDSNDVSYEIPANRNWTSGAQTRWLASVLSKLRAPGSSVDFIVAYMHHSPYSTNRAHGSEGGIRDAWVPLFDKYTVDLVISGHNHCYERTLPLRNGQVTGRDGSAVDSWQGTTYVTAGGGGQSVSPDFASDRTMVSTPDGPEREPANWSLPSRTSAHAVLCADVTPRSTTDPPTMRLRAIGMDGAVLDESLLRRGQPSTQSTGDDLAAWFAGGGSAAAAALGAGVWLAHRHRANASAELTATSGGSEG